MVDPIGEAAKERPFGHRVKGTLDGPDAGNGLRRPAQRVATGRKRRDA